MKTIKIIDLFNKIANGEEVPKKIKYEENIYVYYEAYAGYYEENYQGISNRRFLAFRNEQHCTVLNTEVEIIEEEQDIEELDLKQIENGTGNYYLLNEYGTKCCLTKHSKIIADKVNELVKVVNQLKNKE